MAFLVFLEGELWCARGLIRLSKCLGVVCVYQWNRSSRPSFSKYKALGLGRGITKGEPSYLKIFRNMRLVSLKMT